MIPTHSRSRLAMPSRRCCRAGRALRTEIERALLKIKNNKMQVATLGQLRTVLTKETLFDNKYCISKAVKPSGSTLLLESLGFGETDDPCMLRLTLAEPSDCKDAD